MARVKLIQTTPKYKKSHFQAITQRNQLTVNQQSQDRLEQAGNESAGVATTTETESGTPIYVYPSNLAAQNEKDRVHSSFLVFYFVKPITSGNDLTASSVRSRINSAAEGVLKEEIVSMIQIYKPKLQDNLNIQYDKSESGFAQDLINSVAPELSNALSGDGNVLDMLRAGGQTALEIGQTQLDRIKQESNTQTTGQVFQSRNVTLFKGVTPNSKTFAFDFDPSNKDELKQISYIMREFYMNSLPEVTKPTDTSGTILKVPNLVYVEERFYNGARYTPKEIMGPASITSIKKDGSAIESGATLANTGGDLARTIFEVQMMELIGRDREYYKNLFSNTNLDGNDQIQNFEVFGDR